MFICESLPVNEVLIEGVYLHLFWHSSEFSIFPVENVRHTTQVAAVLKGLDNESQSMFTLRLVDVDVRANIFERDC